MNRFKHKIKKVLKYFGYEINRLDQIAAHYTSNEVKIIDLCKQFSMTTRGQIGFLLDAFKYVDNNAIPGDLVECGVWKGGSALALAKVMENSTSKKLIWLYDTFDGMTLPTSIDRKIGSGKPAQQILDQSSKSTEANVWAYASLEEVKTNILSNTTLNESRFKFISGDVINTLVHDKPSQIALLRLDTDWYESTKAELDYLYERVVPGGIIIIDDYGHWEGSKKAVDDFLRENKLSPLLFPFGSNRIFIKQNF